MIDFKESLKILKNTYKQLECEVLRIDFRYNNFHIFFFYKPTLIDNGHDLLVFNAYIEDTLISIPLYFKENFQLITSIPKELYSYISKINNYPSKIFEEVDIKIKKNNLEYARTNINLVRETHTEFTRKFSKFEPDKPYFWRLRTSRMSTLIEKKLLNYGVTPEQIKFLKSINQTAQFTYDALRENDIQIKLRKLSEKVDQSQLS